jgi:membrane glycosyltransferase
LLGAVTTLRTGLFMFGLLFGRTAVWNGQARDAHALSVATSVRGLWPQMLFGVLVLTIAGIHAPILVLWSLPLTLGYILAVPFAVLTASPQLGVLLARLRLCAIPEEIDRPEVIVMLEHEIGRVGRFAGTSDEVPSVLEPA